MSHSGSSSNQDLGWHSNELPTLPVTPVNHVADFMLETFRGAPHQATQLTVSNLFPTDSLRPVSIAPVSGTGATSVPVEIMTVDGLVSTFAVANGVPTISDTTQCPSTSEGASTNMTNFRIGEGSSATPMVLDFSGSGSSNANTVGVGIPTAARRRGQSRSRRVPTRRQRARTAIVRIYSLGVDILLAFLYLPSFTINYSMAIDSLRKRHNDFLETYFESLANSEDDVIKIKGNIYSTRVTTFNEFVAFLNLLKCDDIIRQEWDYFRYKFDKVFKWFYNHYLNKSLPGPIPPTINGIQVYLLDLYKLIEGLGGYLSVHFGQEFGTIGELIGLSKQDGDELKKCYIKYLDIFTSYYKTGASTIEPVRLTRSPSLIEVSLPKTLTTFLPFIQSNHAIVRIYSLGVDNLLAFLYLPSFTINYSMAIGNQHRVDSNELPTQGPIAPPQREGAPMDYKYFGRCDQVCDHCHAVLWLEEKRTGLPVSAAPEYPKCCAAHEVQHRLSHFEAHERQALREDIIEGLIQFLDDNNALVQLFRTARDKLLEADIPNFQIRLFGVAGSNQYELPTADTIGAIVYEGGPESITDYDVVIERHSREPKSVNKLHPTYMALQFPLLFFW
ncbi:helitron helicase-like domain-containing protein [Artemisia annua]|uniref:Helitron helicase-like domain-containing protein n=1 Tax=Artemisia annua TaxID=35608 RepID=A0A2U1MFG2_ARTAN|nr:helitron helicase-like domain-containing protein [Artemisia annua]